MIVGYARVSTLEQEAGFDAQKRDLAAEGCEKVYAEQVSSVAERPQLSAMLDFIREGDVVVVTKIDRLARSMADFQNIIETIRMKGASLRILGLSLDTSTPTGALILNVLASVAAFEREMMLERQREGIAKAKVEGKYKGKAPLKEAVRRRVLEDLADGKSKTAIARDRKISIRSVYRIAEAGSRLLH